MKEIKGEREFIKILKREKKIKTEFHGNSDFYNLIKGIAIEVSRLNNIFDEKKIVSIINNNIERNFGGIIYEIDIAFNLILNDIKDEIKILENEILNEALDSTYEKRKRELKNDDEDDKSNTIKVSSEFLFKKVYNEACTLEKSKDENTDVFKII